MMNQTYFSFDNELVLQYDKNETNLS